MGRQGVTAGRSSGTLGGGRFARSVLSLIETEELRSRRAPFIAHTALWHPPTDRHPTATEETTPGPLGGRFGAGGPTTLDEAARRSRPDPRHRFSSSLWRSKED